MILDDKWFNKRAITWPAQLYQLSSVCRPTLPLHITIITKKCFGVGTQHSVHRRPPSAGGRLQRTVPAGRHRQQHAAHQQPHRRRVQPRQSAPHSLHCGWVLASWKHTRNSQTVSKQPENGEIILREFDGPVSVKLIHTILCSTGSTNITDL